MTAIPQYDDYVAPLKVRRLQPADGTRNGYQSSRSVYLDFRKWRASNDYKFWLKKQWKFQDGECYYCKCSLKGRQHHVEHVLAISQGGTNRSENLVLSCAQCNKDKGSRRIGQHLEKVARDFNHVMRGRKRGRRV